MTVQYFAKVVDMKPVSVATAQTQQEAQQLIQQQYAPCSRTFYESVVRSQQSAVAMPQGK